MTRTARVGAAVLVMTIAAAPTAWALFTASATATGSFSSATLAPATALTLTWQCPPGTNRTANLAWTASVSAFADGYVVDRLDPTSGAVLGSTVTTSTSFSQRVPRRTIVRFRVTATAKNWRSAGIEITGTAPSGTC